MKKFLLAGVVVIASFAYIFVNRSDATASSALTTDAAATAAQTSSAATPSTDAQTVPASSGSLATTASSGSSNTTKPTPTPTPAPKPRTGQYVDGTYTGSAADAYYGYVQVAAVISGGKLESVKVLQYPNDRGTSVAINRQALPILISEAISAQSANVNGVSGASETSPAFVQSLASALAKAKA